MSGEHSDGDVRVDGFLGEFAQLRAGDGVIGILHHGHVETALPEDFTHFLRRVRRHYRFREMGVRLYHHNQRNAIFSGMGGPCREAGQTG
jgi:hypothetical protein